MNTLVDLPDDSIISIISEIDDPDVVHALSCTSVHMRELTNRPDVKASWLLRHRLDDAVELAALSCGEDVLFHLVDPLWRRQEELCNVGGEPTMFHYACFLGYTSVVSRLLNYNCNVDYNAQDIFDLPAGADQFMDSCSALQLACLEQKTDVVTMLLSHVRERSISWTMYEFAPAIWSACFVGNVQIVAALVDAGADVNFTEDVFRDVCAPDADELWCIPTPLHAASDQGHVQCVSALLSRGANVNSFTYLDEVMVPPIHSACAKGHTGVVQAYLENGVASDAIDAMMDEDNLGPLLIACQFGQVDVVRALLNSGCDVTLGDMYSQTPFHVACKYGRVEVVRLFIERGHDISSRALDVTDHTDYAALHLASMDGHIEVARLLLDAGADPFAVAESGTDMGTDFPIELAAYRCKGDEGNAGDELVCLLKRAMQSRDIQKYTDIARELCEVSDTIVLDYSKEWFGDCR